MRLTIDSSEPLEDAMRVLGALYGVRLEVAGDNGADNAAPAAAGSTRPGRVAPARTATSKSATRRRAELLAVSTSPAEASKAPAQRKRVSRGRRRAGSATNAEIRAWARDHGMTVSGRGRIPAAVMTAYREARAR